MEIGKHLKEHRHNLGFSQDELAEKVYVSRQTISNWENDKSYPDVESLVLLSEIFDVSVDILIKGDIEKMKERINEDNRRKFEKISQIFSLLFVVVIVSIVPLLHFLDHIGILIWIILYLFTMYFAFKVEKFKKQFDIQTYREIVAFSQGQSLDEITKARESGKRSYQKVFLAIVTALITILIAMILSWLLSFI